MHLSRSYFVQGETIRVLQNNVALFDKLYISMQSWEIDLIEFFAHEIQAFPPSVSVFDKLPWPCFDVPFGCGLENRASEFLLSDFLTRLRYQFRR